MGPRGQALMGHQLPSPGRRLHCLGRVRTPLNWNTSCAFSGAALPQPRLLPVTRPSMQPGLTLSWSREPVQ